MRSPWILLSIASLAACSADDPAVDPASGAGGTSQAATSVSMSAIASSSSGPGLPLTPTFTVSGTVVDEEGAPVAGATVLQGGKSYEPTFTTGADGSYAIDISYPGYGVPAVVAAKAEYRSAGFELYWLPEGPVELVLHKAHPPDNPAYVYGEPGVGNDPSTKYCGHCHSSFASLFQTSKHALATKNPLLQDLYAGVSQAYPTAASCQAAGGSWRQGLMPGTASTPIGKCYLGGGVLPDLNTSCGGPSQLACDDPALAPANEPAAFGACADCHAPAIDGVAGGRDLHDAVGVAFDNGVHCDLCHKVKDIELAAPPGVAGRLVLQRPIESGPQPELAPFRGLMFGPFIDVPNSFMGGSPQPKFKEAVFCAGCHEQRQPALLPGESLDPLRWPDGLPVHSTYGEWLAGPYADAGVPCQFCHMPADFELTNTIDLATVENQSITFGFPRPPEDIRQHIFRSPLHGTPRLIDGALFVSIDLQVVGSTLEASVHLTNVGCGHAIPTGEPLRSLLLLVSAESCATPMTPNGGATLFDAGGGARGIVGLDVSAGGAVLTWSASAEVGDVVRAVRPTGVFDDYPGVGLFADPSLTPEEKGLEIHAPVGQAAVIAAGGGQITLQDALPLQAGDVVYLGDPLPSAPSDGQPSLRLAGAAGHAFARVMVDAAGERYVPHYRAVDIASDNRIPPGRSNTSQHSFAIAPGCSSSATLRASVLYRPLPMALAELRGWDAKDYLIATGQATATLP